METNKNQLLKAFQVALEDEIDGIDFGKISPEYADRLAKIEEILNALESLPDIIETESGPVELRKLIEELNELHSDLFGIGFDIAVKHGFSVAFQFINYWLAYRTSL